MAKLLALFILVPLLELAILIQLGRLVGLLPTLGLIVATGFLGAWLARSQGLGVLRQMQVELGEGSVPAGAVVDGVLILLAGGVLLTPGLLTDIAGFLLLVPATRRYIRARVLRTVERAAQEGRGQFRWNIGFRGRKEAGAREPDWEEHPPDPGGTGEARRISEPPDPV